MNTTTNTRGVSEAMYTPEQVETAAEELVHYFDGDGEFSEMLRAYAATLRQQVSDVETMLNECVPGGSIVDPQLVCDNIREWISRNTLRQAPAQGGVTEAMVDKVWSTLMREEGEPRVSPSSVRTALVDLFGYCQGCLGIGGENGMACPDCNGTGKAALSAEPAAQGDAVADECPHEWVDYVQAEYKPRHRVFEPGESNIARYVRIGLMCTTCGKEKPAPATPPFPATATVKEPDMNTTTNTRGVRYTAERVARAAGLIEAAYPDERLAVDMLRAYAAALSAEPAAQGEEVVDRVAKAIADAAGHGMREKWEHMAHAAIAALSAPEPAAQGDVGPVVAWMTKAGSVINTETRERVLADAELGGEYIAAAKAAEAYCIPLYAAPPAQPAGITPFQEKCIAFAESKRVSQPAEPVTQPDDAIFVGTPWEQRKRKQPAERLGVAGALADMRDAVGGCCDQLQERIKQLEAQPAERVPEGWVLLPEDLWTHRHDWHKACVMARKHSSSADDKVYWTHQLKTLDNVNQAMLTATPAPSEGGKGGAA